MNLLYVTSNIPHSKGEAVETVNLEILKALEDKIENVYLLIILAENATFAEKENIYLNDLKKLKIKNIKILPILESKRKIDNIFLLSIRYLFPTKKTVYPSSLFKKKIQKIVDENNIDTIFQSWDYPGVAAVNEIKVLKKILYYGQPDHKPSVVRLADGKIFDIQYKGFLGLIKKFLLKRASNFKEKCHLDMIKNFDEIHTICYGAYQDYLKNGIKKIQYTQNIWPISDKISFEPKVNNKCKIVGSVGSNNATGNGINFYYIGKYLRNKLDKKLKKNYEINFYGKFTTSRYLSNLLNSERLIFRGWVKDLDKEVISSDIFLICHNSIYENRFIKSKNGQWQMGGCHTRFLYAWSVGCPIVTHSMNKKFMPELEHNYNVLMGDNEEEIANHISNLYKDIKLRKKLILNGNLTLMKYFTPEVVVKKLFKIGNYEKV